MTKETANADKPLDKMTVKELREIAKDVPDLTGVHAMKKQELVDAITAHQADAGSPSPEAASEEKPKVAAKPKAKPKAKTKAAGAPKKEMTASQIKQLIRELRQQKSALVGQKDRRQTEILRKQISRLKKRTRRAK